MYINSVLMFCECSIGKSGVDFDLILIVMGLIVFPLMLTREVRSEKRHNSDLNKP
jgi:hypothetical protein